MLKRRSFVFSVLALCYTSVSGAQAEHSVVQDIILHSDDVHLTSRVNENFQPYSTSVDTAQLLLDSIGYKQPVLNIPLVRSFNQMDAGLSICIMNKIKNPERNNKYIFSLPLNFFQTQRLYQLSSLEPIGSELLDENGAIKSLKNVTESYVDSAIVLPKTNSFGTRVDEELASLARDKKVTLSNQTFYTRFMDLFSAGKADFALIFPASIYTRFGKSMPVDVRSYPISGNPRFVSGHILCSDTHAGNEFIVRVNKGIESLYQNPQYVKAHTDYLPSTMNDTLLLGALSNLKRQ
ncbi:hypothetical protein OAP14_08590 [Aliiglaciecola sp.]|nr:hypothetical protein [Aliiglaciecola sp.]